MQYGLFGKESQEKPEQIENLKQQLIAQGYDEKTASKMASDAVNNIQPQTATQSVTTTPNTNTQGVSTTGDTRSGVKVSGDQSTGVKVGGATNDTLDQATISTIDQNDIDNLVTIPDDQLEAAVAAVADGHNVDAAALRKHIDAQREAISNTQQQ